ncbi:MAG: UvrD-helicase domain-containing protein [Firmicutes bacterium]|nr:UvrD-helicase domain-containing protein [Bacillota bacterium]
MSSFTDSAKLNKEQLEAVCTTEGPLLILAGAGSGKTRVLTHRIAHLVLDCDVCPYNILAITFTNKAAKEMKERVENMCGDAAGSILISTFHSACVRILRRDIEHLDGYSHSFTIFDDDDTNKLLAEVCKTLNLDTKQFPVKMLKACISNAKNSMKDADMLSRDQFSPIARVLPDVFAGYEKMLRKNNALDFDDLILKTIELFDKNPDVLQRYQERFRYIMVDEYQDTNASQYRLIRLLGAKWKNVCAVGDDDQSIYSWRGADVSIIRSFQKDYKNARIIKLEQNYRSTTTILNAANALISHNTDRTPKRLWSELGEGDKITYHLYDDDRAEAAAIAGIIADGSRNGAPLSDYAVLYRTNSSSRNLEAALMARGIPYRIYGGHRFFERAEIKDALAYLRILVNPNDEISFRRIINVPKRGIGATTLDELASAAFEHNESLLTVAMFPQDYDIKPKTALKLKEFASVIEDCAAQCVELPPSEAIRYMLERTGLAAQYSLQPTEESAARSENLNELINDAAQFTQNNPEGTLEDYLEQVSLVNDLEAADEAGGTGAVNMMTIHSAKGLEFKTVFLVAFEDGIFPISRAFDSVTDMEEERRLAYVAVTRAKRKLYISGARQRMTHGYIGDSLPSRFLREIPDSLLEQPRPAAHSYRFGGFNRSNWGNSAVQRSRCADEYAGEYADEYSGGAGRSPERAAFGDRPRSVSRGGSIFSEAPAARGGNPSDYSVGDMVKHRSFGSGRIIGIKGSGKDTVLQIAFAGKGIKELAAAFAPLEKL